MVIAVYVFVSPVIAFGVGVFGFFVGRCARKLPVIDNKLPWAIHRGQIPAIAEPETGCSFHGSGHRHSDHAIERPGRLRLPRRGSPGPPAPPWVPQANSIDGASMSFADGRGRVYPLIDAIMAQPFIPAVKAGLAAAGFPVGSPGEPIAGLDPAAAAIIAELAAGLHLVSAGCA